MNKDIIRAYLWQDIIRLGFSPLTLKDQKSWLFLYGQSLKRFWEVVDYPKPPTRSGASLSATIDTSISIGMTFQYAIEKTQKFTVTLMYAPPIEERVLMWVHDMDGSYFSFPKQSLLVHRKQRKQAILEMNVADIAEVIDSLIIHPTPHQHIKSPVDNLNIRVGGGLLNPFLYLFHLRTQLCPDKDLRKAERARLISVFDTAIRGDSVITPSELMKIPE